MSDGPYSRIYWQVLREFPELGRDIDLFGAWGLLLVGADMAWDGTDARPFLPRHISDTVLARLVTMGLVTVDGPYYGMRGHVKERAARSAQASKASNARWNAPSIAAADTTPDAAASGGRMPSKAKQSRAKQSKPDALDAYFRLKGGQVSEGAISMIEEMVADFGDEAVIRHLGTEAERSAIDRTFLSRVKSSLAVTASRNTKAAEAAQKKRDGDYLRDMAGKAAAQTSEQKARNDEAMAAARDVVKDIPA